MFNIYSPKLFHVYFAVCPPTQHEPVFCGGGSAAALVVSSCYTALKGLSCSAVQWLEDLEMIPSGYVMEGVNL